MLPVSKEFHAAMVADNRRTFGRVTIDYTGPFVDQNITASANEQANAAALLTQVADGVTDPVRRWASCDGSTLADGNSFPAPATTADGQMGWWGTQMAGAGGAFVIPFPTLTVAFASRPIHSLRVVGDLRRNEWPVDFEIRLLGIGGIVRHTHTVTGNTLMDWQVTITPVTEVTQCVVEVRRWTHAGRQAKVVETLTSIQETYEGNDIFSVGLLEEREIAQHSLPVGNVSANEITLKLDNSTRKFDAGNRQSSLYQLLVQNRRIRAWLGVLPEKATTETTQADWAAGTLSGVRTPPAGDLVLDEAVATTFSRESAAFLQDGSLVAARTPRYEVTRFPVGSLTPRGIVIEEGTTNHCSLAQSQGQGATTFSGSVVTQTLTQADPFGGLNAVRIQASGGTATLKALLATFAPANGVAVSGQIWVRNNISTQLTVFSNQGSRSNVILQSEGWRKILWENIIGNGVGDVQFQLVAPTIAGVVDCTVAFLQYEEKPFATSWQIGGTPRAAEFITVPSSVYNRGNWTVEGIYTPQITIVADTYMFEMQADGSNRWVVAILSTRAWFAGVVSAGVWHIIVSASNAVVQGFPYHWQLSGDGTHLRFFVNGVQVGATLAYTEPIVPLPAFLFIGSRHNNTRQANGFIHNVRFSNRARTLAEHQADFNTGQPLAVDAATTYLARFDGSLLNSVHLPSGTRVSPAIDASFLADTVSAAISWTATVPAETALAVETSLDGGTSWQPATNGGQIVGIAAGQNMAGISLLTRQMLTTQNAGVTPQLHDLTIKQINREFIPLGTFWSGEWHATSEKLYASTTGRDRLELLRKSTYAMSHVAVNQSLHALATAVLTDAGLATTEYWIDPVLHSIIVPNAWFGTLSHREALRQIAEASLGQVYADRNGVVRVEGAGHLLGQESFVSPMMSSAQSLTISADDYFRKDTPVKWGELANRIEVETQPLRAAATAQEVFRSNEPVALAADQTVTLTVRYNEPPVIEAVASLSGAPAGATITGTTFFAWGATVTIVNGANAGAFTLAITGRPLKVLNKERAVAEDAASIRDNGLLRYEYPANHLVQTLDRAQTIADTLLRLYRHPRRDLTMEWRGNPALTLGDMIITRDHQDWLRYWVTKQEIDYDGALRARLEGRLAR